MRVRWLGLAAITTFLALDEAFDLHRAVRLFSRIAKPTSNSTLNFLLVAVVGLVVFAGLYGRFLKQLPSKSRILLVGGITVYFAGLVGPKLLETFSHVMRAAAEWNSRASTLFG